MTKTILPKTTVTIDLSSERVAYLPYFDLVPDETYTVIFNSETYVLVAAGNVKYTVHVGNPGITDMGQPFTDEDFEILSMPSNSASAIVLANRYDGPETITVSVYQGVVEPSIETPTVDPNYLTDLFINEAKAALDSKGGAVSPDQINSAVENYLEENPVSSASATIENNILKVT